MESARFRLPILLSLGLSAFDNGRATADDVGIPDATPSLCAVGHAAESAVIDIKSISNLGRKRLVGSRECDYPASDGKKPKQPDPQG